MGRIENPDLKDYGASLGWHGTSSIRAKWRSLSSARASTLKKDLTQSGIVREAIYVSRPGWRGCCEDSSDAFYRLCWPALPQCARKSISARRKFRTPPGRRSSRRLATICRMPHLHCKSIGVIKFARIPHAGASTIDKIVIQIASSVRSIALASSVIFEGSQQQIDATSAFEMWRSMGIPSMSRHVRTQFMSEF